jgi:hypothetical protein
MTRPKRRALRSSMAGEMRALLCRRTIACLVIVAVVAWSALTLAGPSTSSGAAVHGRAPVRFLLLGDSVALTLGQGLSVDSVQHDGVMVDDQAVLGCDLDPTLLINTSGAVGPATPGCPDWRTLWPTLLQKYRPQVVGLELGRWEVSDHDYEGQWVHVGQKIWDDHLMAELDQAVRILSSQGAKVVLFTMPYVDPAGLAANGQPFSENTPGRADAYNRLVRQVAAHNRHDVTFIDLNHMLSPAGHYTATVKGVTVRWSDGIHISVAGGEMVQPAVLSVVGRLGRRVHLPAASA